MSRNWIAALPGAICAGACVCFLVLAVFPPRRRLRPRVHDYTLVARAKLGSGPGALCLARRPPPAMPGAVVRVLGPMLEALPRRFAALARLQDDAALELQLRQAGVRGLTPKAYRQQQLVLAFLGALAGVSTGAVLGAAVGEGAVPVAVLLGSAGFALGAVWKTTELSRRIRERQARLRAELFSLCHVLAISARATPNLLHLTEQVTSRSRGELVGELEEVLVSVESGTPPALAFAEAARLTAEPAAARLYRAMATAHESGADLAEALLAQSADIRDLQREEAKRVATRRRAGMLAPMLVFLAPIMIVFVAAPLPRIVLGF
ncbi:MAG: type II secretion system F family protein [Actinomycetota bacterium]|nr:type II secretion system F family protein [Actinomycetota bacterium]